MEKIKPFCNILMTVETYGYHDQSISGTYEMKEWLTELN